MSNPGDFSQIVKQQADIVRIVGDYVQLKKSGAQNLSGLCPFHSEKTPSFSVHATRQFYHCFGCGASGDVFSFVQKVDNITFPEAVRAVAQKLGIPLPKATYSGPAEAKEAQVRGQLVEMHERACIFFEEQLQRPEGAKAREYLSGRGLSAETIKTFRIGYAPDSGFLLRDRLKSAFSEELLRASGLFSWKQEEKPSPPRGAPSSAPSAASAGPPGSAIYSKFRNRIVFPISNEAGKVIAFTGRTLLQDEKAGPKYLNSPETPIYSKGRVLYNLDRAREAIRKLEYAIIVEGQMDCIAVYAAGFHNVIASSGTAFTETQVRLLARFTRNIVVNFDPDLAGAAATDRSLAMLVEEEFQIKVLSLEAGLDPDLFIRNRGAGGYAQALQSSQKYFDYLIDRARAAFPARTPESKVKALNFLLPHIHRVPSRISRDELAGEVAQKLGIDSAVLRQELKQAAGSRTSTLKAAVQDPVTPAERVLIQILSSNPADLSDPELARSVRAALSAERLHAGLASEALIDKLLAAADIPSSSSSGPAASASAVSSGDASAGTPSASEPAFDPMSLPLDDSERKLLASVLFEDQEELTAGLLTNSLDALRRRQLERRRRDLKARISDAERRNDPAAVARLMQEKLAVDRALAQG